MNGIVIQGRYPGEGDVSHGHVISNNLIHDIGELEGHGSGVDISSSGGNEVSYSVIHDVAKAGLLWHGTSEIAPNQSYVQK